MSTTPYSVYRQTHNSYVVKSGFRLTNEPRRPLAYSSILSFGYVKGDGPNWGEGNLPYRNVMTSHRDTWTPEARTAHNRAYAKLVSKLGPRAELGTTLVEYRSSVSMIVQRASQLRAAWTALKQGRFREFKRVLGIGSGRRDPLRSKPKEAGKLWLEYWMGWAPMFGDIFTSLDILTSTLPPVTIRAASKCPWTWRHRFDNWWTNISRSAAGEVIVLMQATVRISNPNLYLANRLGVLNPIEIAWNVIPWSWMVGWVVNIHQVITSMTDFVGISYDKAFTTRYVKGSARGIYESRSPGWINTDRWKGGCMTRGLALTAPQLHFMLPPRLSPTRAATAIGLLLQKLRG